MFAYKDDEKERFKKNLFTFLQSRGATNLKVPQIGGKELDLYELYQSVIRKGGAQKVSNSKMWKEIVNEFDLPPSCTSASFTLKNHYQKYLLAYEQKFFFGKKEDEMVRELGNVRNRRPHNDPNRDHKNEIPKDRLFLSDTNLKQNLTTYYEDKKKNHEYLTFLRRSSLMAYSGELRRVMLAFESRVQEEVRFALNCLLLYSCSTNSPYNIENGPMVFEGMISYLEGILPLIPEVFNRESDRMVEEPVQDVYMGGLGDITVKQGISPIEILKKDRKQLVTMRYEEVAKSEVLEQVRIVFQVIRNLICIPQNEALIFKHKKVYSIVLDTFFTCLDQDINRAVLDIISILCKHILIATIPNKNSKIFCNKIIDYLASEVPEESESALECFHNLMLSQENEIIIEGMLPEMIESITKLLFTGNTELTESCLEILCYLSDLKMSTRVFLSKKNNLLSRLLALIGSNVSKSSEKTAKLSSLILSNLCVTPASKQCFIPYEKDIFCLATTDDTVSEQLSSILAEIDPVTTNIYSASQDFYSKKKKQLISVESN